MPSLTAQRCHRLRALNRIEPMALFFTVKHSSVVNLDLADDPGVAFGLKQNVDVVVRKGHGLRLVIGSISTAPADLLGGNLELSRITWMGVVSRRFVLFASGDPIAHAPCSWFGSPSTPVIC